MNGGSTTQSGHETSDLPFKGKTGVFNAITDVAGVEVGTMHIDQR